MSREEFLKDSKSNYKIAKEEQEVCLDREMRRSILQAQEIVENCTNTKDP